MLIISFLITITMFFLCIVLKIHEAQLTVRKRIDTFVNGEYVESKSEKEQQRRMPLKERIHILRERILSFTDKNDGFFGKKLSSQKELKLEKRLLQAGQPWGMTTVEFQVFKMSVRVVIPLVFMAYGGLLHLGYGITIILTFVGLVLAIFLPDYVINKKIRKRYKQALKELPDFLDLLTVSLEAGLGFDMALNKVISKRNGVLSSEFHVCLEEMRLGKTRKEALSGVKDRLEFDELKSLINSILQAEKLGISIVQIFRIKSQEEREKRRQRAEEEAMKAPIKILFPLVLFIFPSIFIVILGPVVIQFMQVFGGK